MSTAYYPFEWPVSEAESVAALSPLAGNSGHLTSAEVEIDGDEPSVALPGISRSNDNPETLAAAAIIDGIFRAAQQLRHVVNDHLSDFGLNEARFAALQIIQEHADEGCTQSILADRLQQSESSISGLVRRMRASGLLYRLRSKTDQRKWGLLLSDQGRRMLDDLAQCHSERMRELLREFDRGQLLSFAELLNKLLDEVGKSLKQREQSARGGESRAVPAA